MKTERKAITVLKHLSEKDIQLFRKFTKEIYKDNLLSAEISDAVILRLVQMRKNNISMSKDINLDSHISKQIKSIPKAFSSTYRMLEKFLLLNYFEQNEEERDLLLARLFTKSSNYSLAHLALRNLENGQNGPKLKEAAYRRAYEHCTIENDLHQFEARQLATKEINNLLDNCIRYFLLEILQIYIFYKSESKIFRGKFFRNRRRPDLMIEVMEYVKAKSDHFRMNDPIIFVYGLILRMVCFRKKEDFESLLGVSSSIFESEYDNNIKNSVYINLANFCTDRFKDSKMQDYYRGVKFALDKAVFLSIKLPFNWRAFPTSSFINAVRNAVKLKEFSWCRDFIERYQKHTAAKERKFLMNFCRAIVEFYDPDSTDPKTLGKYINSIQNEVHTVHNQIEYQFRTLKNQVQYESPDFDKSDLGESLISSLEADSKWLLRDEQITGSLKRVFKKEIKFFKKLVIARMCSFANKNEADELFAELTAELAKSLYFFEKQWMQQKIEELEKRL